MLLVWEDPLEKQKATHPSILAWRIPWTEESLVGYSLWGRKELDTTEWLSLTHTMTNDVVHHLTCLLAICLSSLVKCLFKSFIHFWTGLFLLLNYRRCSHILDINLLSNIWFGSIFSYLVSYVFILFTVSFDAYKFILIVCNLCIFCCLCFWCYIQTINKSKAMRIFSYIFFLRVL